MLLYFFKGPWSVFKSLSPLESDSARALFICILLYINYFNVNKNLRTHFIAIDLVSEILNIANRASPETPPFLHFPGVSSRHPGLCPL